MKYITQEDFKFYEDAIQQLKEFYLINLNQIKKIPELYDIDISNLLIYFVGKPYYSIFKPREYSKYEFLSLQFPTITRGTLNNLINLLNFMNFEIDVIIQNFIQYEIISIENPELKQTHKSDNLILYEYEHNDIKYYSFEPLQILKAFKILRLQQIPIVYKNQLLNINYDKLSKQNLIPSNLFHIILKPYYYIDETIWYECFVKQIPIRDYLKTIIRLNTPIEFIFTVDVLTGQSFREFKLVDYPTIFLKVINLSDSSWHFLSSYMFNSKI